jgi:hypothetical protein
MPSMLVYCSSASLGTGLVYNFSPVMGAFNLGIIEFYTLA